MKRYIWTTATAGAYGATIHIAKNPEYPRVHQQEGLLNEQHLAVVEVDSHVDGRVFDFMIAARELGFHICECDKS